MQRVHNKWVHYFPAEMFHTVYVWSGSYERRSPIPNMMTGNCTSSSVYRGADFIPATKVGQVHVPVDSTAPHQTRSLWAASAVLSTGIYLSHLCGSSIHSWAGTISYHRIWYPHSFCLSTVPLCYNHTFPSTSQQAKWESTTLLATS